MGLADAIGEDVLQKRAQFTGLCLAHHGGRPIVLGYPRRIFHIAATGDLHLDGMHAAGGIAIMARGPAAAKPSVDHEGEIRPAASGFDIADDAPVRRPSIVGADIQMRQDAVEKPRYDGTDGVRVIEDDAMMEAPKAGDLLIQHGMIRIEEKPAAARDLFFTRLQPFAIKRLAIEGGDRAKRRRGLAGIKRFAGRIAIDIDHGTRDRGPEAQSAASGTGPEQL